MNDLQYSDLDTTHDHRREVKEEASKAERGSEEEDTAANVDIGALRPVFRNGIQLSPTPSSNPSDPLVSPDTA